MPGNRTATAPDLFPAIYSRPPLVAMESGAVAFNFARRKIFIRRRINRGARRSVYLRVPGRQGGNSETGRRARAIA